MKNSLKSQSDGATKSLKSKTVETQKPDANVVPFAPSRQYVPDVYDTRFQREQSRSSRDKDWENPLKPKWTYSEFLAWSALLGILGYVVWTAF